MKKNTAFLLAFIFKSVKNIYICENFEKYENKQFRRCELSEKAPLL